LRSAWWWGTDEWEAYQRAYYVDRTRPDAFKSSPLEADHVFDDLSYQQIDQRTLILDLTRPLSCLWTEVRKSYHSLIHRAHEIYTITSEDTEASVTRFMALHRAAFGVVRSEETFAHQANWVRHGHGLVVLARGETLDGVQGVDVAGAYWILYHGCAYYASGPSVVRNVQHAVLWHSIDILRARGVRLVDLGPIDRTTPKDQNISLFKSGFSRTAVPFTTMTRGAR
jgi:hypothetical protein